MRWIGLVLASALLSGCHSDPDCAVPSGPLDAAAYGAEAAAVAAADEFILGELGAARAAGGWDAARLDEAARSLGFSGGGELAEIVERGCLRGDDVPRFARARGVSGEAAARYLQSRFGLAACAP
jgi:hypothetical protein